MKRNALTKRKGVNFSHSTKGVNLSHSGKGVNLRHPSKGVNLPCKCISLFVAEGVTRAIIDQTVKVATRLVRCVLESISDVLLKQG